MENEKKFLNIHTVSVCLSGYKNVIDRLVSDFNYFACDEISAETNLSITVNLLKPPYEKIPETEASMYKTDCICYDNKDIRYADYNGKCLTIFNKKNKTAEIFSLNIDLLYEVSYLFLHSQVGELLDMKGFHRIHACAFSYKKTAFLCILPQGGGKSTLLMSLLQNKDIKLLSDDTPLIDTKGNLYPFPIRIGVCNDFDTSFIPEKFITVFNRRKFSEKKLISYVFFKNQIEETPLPIKIISCKRFYGNNAKIVCKNKFFAFKELFKACILGYGLPQVLEYFLIGGFKDVTKKTYILFSRFYCCMILLIKSINFYEFYLSKDKKTNSDYFLKIFNK